MIFKYKVIYQTLEGDEHIRFFETRALADIYIENLVLAGMIMSSFEARIVPIKMV